jgi:S1-C subfamily serine protease
VPEKSVFNAALIRDKLGMTLELSPNGFVITEVQRGSPAGLAGVLPGMWIRALDGQVPSDVTGMAKMLSARPKGQAVRLELVVVQQMGNLSVLRPAGVELVPR